MNRRNGFAAALTAIAVMTVWVGSAGATTAVARPVRTRRAGGAEPSTCTAAWTVVPSAGGAGTLNGVAESSSTSAWAVGYNTNFPSAVTVLHWDGATWGTVAAPSPVGGRLLGVAAIGTKNVWAVGSIAAPSARTKTLVEHGTANGWKVTKSPSTDRGDELSAVSGSSTSDVWAVGSREVGKKSDALIEHYDGTAWTVSDTSLLQGQIGLTGVKSISATDAWAAGSKDLGNGRTITFAAHWDGTTWTPVNTPNVSNLLDEFRAIGGSSSDDVWAVGDTLTSLSGPTITSLTEHYDGTRWRVVASPNPTSTTFLYGVTSTTGTNAVAIGALDEFRSPEPFAWDGTAWTAQTTPQSNSILTAVAAIPSGPIWAVGETSDDANSLIEESCP